MRRSALAAVLVVTAAAACSRSNPARSGSAGPAVQRAEMRPAGAEDGASGTHGSIVGKVQFRDHVLVIRTGRDELRYDVETRGGLLLASSLSRSQLSREFPAIGDQFRDSTAIQIDASLDEKPGDPAERSARP